MAENSNRGVWLGVGMGIGLIVGGLFIYIATRKTEPPVQTANVPLSPQQPYILAVPHTQDMSAEIQRLHAEIHRLQMENEELRAQLQIAAPPGLIITQASSPSLPKSAKPVAPAVPAASGTTYQNNETWEVERRADGSIKSLKVIRDAKAS